MSRKSWRSVKEIRIADVARLAGVSTATVSRVLSSPDKVRQKTHDLVMEAVRRSGYIPNSTARNLRTRRTMNVLVVVPNLANPVFAQILRGVDDELTRAGYALIIGSLDNSPEREARYVDLALSQQIDGIILMNGRIPGSAKRSMNEAGLPMVAMCAEIAGVKIPNVTVQDREASCEAALYLTELGHRRLGYIGGPAGHVIERERFSGFKEGVRAAGLEEGDFVTWNGPFAFSSGVAAAEKFLSMKERPTGIFATCDESAIGFIKRVREARVRVPQDVSIIGFDGIEFADYTEPALTTFQQPFHAMGRAGAETLLKMIRQDMKPDDWNVRLPLTLLKRGTTGPVLHKDYKLLRRRTVQP